VYSRVDEAPILRSTVPIVRIRNLARGICRSRHQQAQPHPDQSSALNGLTGFNLGCLASVLAQGAYPSNRPVAEDGFAVDEVFIHRAKIAAVVGEIAMVA